MQHVISQTSAYLPVLLPRFAHLQQPTQHLSSATACTCILQASAAVSCTSLHKDRSGRCPSTDHAISVWLAYFFSDLQDLKQVHLSWPGQTHHSHCFAGKSALPVHCRTNTTTGVEVQPTRSTQYVPDLAVVQRGLPRREEVLRPGEHSSSLLHLNHMSHDCTLHPGSTSSLSSSWSDQLQPGGELPSFTAVWSLRSKSSLRLHKSRWLTAQAGVNPYTGIRPAVLAGNSYTAAS